MHLFLTGYRAVGKSTIARLLQTQLGMPMIDLDAAVTESAGRTIAEIFADGGEPAFRVIESRVLLRCIGGPPTVISLGGGTIIDRENRRRIRGSGRTVWLAASAETIAERIAADASSIEGRPPLTSLTTIEEVRALLQQRGDWYREVSDLCVDTDDHAAESIAEQIATWWTGPPANPPFPQSQSRR